jgi:RNA polymerase sigma factor (sigma-70 family)
MKRTCDCPPYDCAGRVAAYLGGDRNAGSELILRFRPLVLRIVQRVLTTRFAEEWDDATQVVLLHVLQRLHTWRGDCPFCKFLAVVVARKTIDYRRALDGMPPLPADVSDPRQLDPRDSLFDLRECVEGKLGRMPDRWARAWNLYVDGATATEAAKELGVSVRTFHYWLANIRAELSGCVGEPG